MEYQFANAWEAIADALPDQAALICGTKVRTWREYDDRAARIATALVNAGLGADAKVGIYLHNSNEYLEAQYAVFKISGCPINVNYRYKADELIYLLDNADAEALVYQSCYAARIWEIQARLPKVRCYIEVADGTENIPVKGRLDYESSIRELPPMPRLRGRRADETYMLYTGGTTGMPKGVMYPNGAVCAAFIAGGFAAVGMEPPASIDALPSRVRDLHASGHRLVSLAACPLMHGTGMWLGAMMPLLAGGIAVTINRLGFDPDLIWDEVARLRVTDIAIVGDAFAKPLLTALDDAAAHGSPYDLSSLRRIVSSGVMWSTETKQGLLRHHDMTLHDAMGSTEGGMAASVATRSSIGATARFALSPGVKVFTDAGEEVQPGSAEIGKVATSGLVPLGYYKDPDKSAQTFRVIDGVRYSFPGDYAQVQADGSMTLLGRGSQCINTAGEKVFPEEVEEAVKRHPAVFDCLVVGLPDLRFGERVVAVVALREGHDASESAIVEFLRERIAGYKIPKRVLLVDVVKRAANGKADYKWAKQTALERDAD